MRTANSDLSLPGLISPAPHSDIPAEQLIFAPFIGSWDLIVTWREEGRATRVARGEWRFAWALEGRGVQDVWIVPPRVARNSDADLYEYGTSIRFYDPSIEAWRSTWIGPMHGVVRTFIARRIGEIVRLETTSDVSPAMRWEFSDIERDSFIWRNFQQRGADWELAQDFVATRMAAS